MCCLIGLPGNLLGGLSTYNTLPIFLLLVSHLLSYPVVTTQQTSNGSSLTERFSREKSNNSNINPFTDYTKHVSSMAGEAQRRYVNATKQPNVTLTEALSSPSCFSSSSIHPSSKLSPWNRDDQNENKAFEVFYKIRGWLILCVVLCGIGFLLITHYLTRRRVQPRYNKCCRIIC